MRGLESDEVERRVRESLKKIYDPEIPINVVDLGLIREIKLEEGEDGRRRLRIRYTLTAPGCPLAAAISAMIVGAAREAAGLGYEVEAELETFPPWTPVEMTEEGRKQFRERFGYDLLEAFVKRYGSVEAYVEAVRKAYGLGEGSDRG